MTLKKLLDEARQFIRPSDLDVDEEEDYFADLKKASQRTQFRVLGEAIVRAKEQLKSARDDAARYTMPGYVKFVAIYKKGNRPRDSYSLCAGETMTISDDDIKEEDTVPVILRLARGKVIETQTVTFKRVV